MIREFAENRKRARVVFDADQRTNRQMSGGLEQELILKIGYFRQARW